MQLVSLMNAQFWSGAKLFFVALVTLYSITRWHVYFRKSHQDIYSLILHMKPTTHCNKFSTNATVTKSCYHKRHRLYSCRGKIPTREQDKTVRFYHHRLLLLKAVSFLLQNDFLLAFFLVIGSRNFLKPNQTSTLKLFCKNSLRLKAVLNTPLDSSIDFNEKLWWLSNYFEASTGGVL